MAGSRGVARWTVLGLAFLASFALVAWALLKGLDAAEVVSGPVRLDVVEWLGRRMERIEADRGQRRQVIFVGDSLSMDMKPPDESVPRRLSEDLDAHAGMGTLTASGLDIYSHYFLSEPVAALDADLVVLEVNLRNFSPAKRPRGHLAVWLPTTRWPEAASLPLHEAQASLDQLIFYRSVARAGGLNGLHSLQKNQVRVVQGYRSLAHWLQRMLGDSDGLVYLQQHILAVLGRTQTGNRQTRHDAEMFYGPALAGVDVDAPALKMLDAILGALTRSGNPVVLYTAPLNVEHLRRLEMYDAHGIATTISRIRDVARRHDADLIDLHDLLPDAAFGDSRNHLDYESEVDGAGLIAQRIAPVVLRRLEQQRQKPSS